jgi:DNA/RNA-binding domain of Phe-tRNA-synthetase-like protein
LCDGEKINLSINTSSPDAMAIELSLSASYKAQYKGVAFGLALITGCQNPENPPGFDQYKRKLLRKMRRRETLNEISQRIDIYDRFFKSFGYECPLPKHLRRTINSGFPKYNLMVDAHFMAEMCSGILVAAGDYDRFDGPLTLDTTEEGETCKGMGGRHIRTKTGEIVLRDERDIVCVLCQGADEKTRVKADTQNALFYAYAVPGIEAHHIEQGLTTAAETVAQFGNGTIESIRVF